jgi:hypothetical protein
LLTYGRLAQDGARTLQNADPTAVEIELTEAMIEAGIEAYYSADFDPGSPFSLRETIERIYRAMQAETPATRAGRAVDAG